MGTLFLPLDALLGSALSPRTTFLCLLPTSPSPSPVLMRELALGKEINLSSLPSPISS